MKTTSGFTLVELVITIAIVIVLSVVSVPIYRGNVEKAKMSEGYALIGSILSAQKAYISEYRNFYYITTFTSYAQEMGVDARGNKYFTTYSINLGEDNDPKCTFKLSVSKPEELATNGKNNLVLLYNRTAGSTFSEE